MKPFFMKSLLFTYTILFVLTTLSQAMEKEKDDKSIKSISVQLNLDDQSSEKIFDLQKKMRELVNECPEISGHYKHDYKLTYTSVASYPHITIEVFNHINGDGSLTTGEAGRLPTLFRVGQNFRNKISPILCSHKVEYGLPVFGTELKFIVKSQEKKKKPYWTKTTPDKPDDFGKMEINKNYYSIYDIGNLEENSSNKDIISASIVLKITPASNGIFKETKKALISAIKSDKNMSKYFKVAHDLYNETVWHVTLLKLKAVRTPQQAQYLLQGGEKKGSADMLWDIPNPFDNGAKILHDLFTGINGVYLEETYELFCDKLVTNPMFIKQDAKGSSPEKDPSRKPGDYHDKNSLDLKSFNS